MNPSNTSEIESNPTGESESGGAVAGITGAKQRIKVAARETADQVKQAAASTFNRAKEETGKLASDKKQAAADRIGGYSSAIHDTAKSLEEKDPNIAWFTHRAAARLQGVADYVRDRDFGGLRSDAENLARRHPAAFFGGLFVAGLVIGNLLKASARSGGGSDSTGEAEDVNESGGNASGGSTVSAAGGIGTENQVTI